MRDENLKRPDGKIDAEANLASRKKEVADHSLKNALDLMVTEVLHRRKTVTENDVPSEEVREAFRKFLLDHHLLMGGTHENFLVNLEGKNLPLTDATQIVGDGTRYDIEHISKMLRSMTPEERLALSPSPKMMPFIADVYMIPEDKKP